MRQCLGSDRLWRVGLGSKGRICHPGLRLWVGLTNEVHPHSRVEWRLAGLRLCYRWLRHVRLSRLLLTVGLRGVLLLLLVLKRNLIGPVRDLAVPSLVERHRLRVLGWRLLLLLG